MKRVAIFILSLLLLLSGAWYIYRDNSTPYLPTFVDPIEGTITISDEDVPLASVKTTSKTTTKTKHKKSTKKVKMKSAAKKSYRKKLPTKVKTTKKTSNKKASKANVTTQVVTKTTTATIEQYTKKSKIKKVTSNVTTEITTTVTTTTATSANTQVAAAAAPTQPQTEPAVKKTGLNVRAVAPKMDARVLNAFESLGFSLNVDSTANYTGCFSASGHCITMKDETDPSIYHELGHFLAFIANNVDKTSEFQAIFTAEKDSYTKYNKAYVTQNASEYFAESVKDYILENSTLKAQRPQTYDSIVSALNKITDVQINAYKSIYGVLWA